MRHAITGPKPSGWRELFAAVWPLLQGAVAATIAWRIALDLVGNRDPFFAPISAVVALNAPRGERGLNALRLLIGVIVGILCGELTTALLGAGFGRLTVAIVVAVVVARAIGSARIVIAQAASSAILTVVVANGEAGPDRLVDALIGAGVALVFSQLLFSPEPVRLVRRAEGAALSKMADGIELAARALERDDDELAMRATNDLRALHDRLSELERARLASARVVRHSLAWRTRMTTVVRENENADHLDLLGASCLMLARNAAAVGSAERRTLGASVRELAEALRHASIDPGDPARRQCAVEHALNAGRMLAATEVKRASALDDAIVSARMVAADVMVFAGVDAKAAHAAVRAGRGELEVPAAPEAPMLPFGLDRLPLEWPDRSRRGAPGQRTVSADEHPKP